MHECVDSNLDCIGSDFRGAVTEQSYEVGQRSSLQHRVLALGDHCNAGGHGRPITLNLSFVVHNTYLEAHTIHGAAWSYYSYIV